MEDVNTTMTTTSTVTPANFSTTIIPEEEVIGSPYRVYLYNL